MRLHRFFVKEKIGSGAEVRITEERIIHQIKNVFRLGSGEGIIIFNGDGTEKEAEIVRITKDDLVIKIGAEREVRKFSKDITLYMSVIKKENFELVSEKATELGVSRIVPLCTERTLLKNLNPERIEKILMEASEQSGRGDVPVLCGSTNLQDALEKESKEERKIIICDMDGVSAKDFDFGSTLSIFIGPEGGWSEKEKEIFEKYNTQTISLGSLTLRAETAAIAALAFAGI